MASASALPFCVACGVDTSENRKNRRRLSSSQPLTTTLCVVLNSVLAESDCPLALQLYLDKLSRCYACRNCYRALEKLQKLRKQVSQSVEELTANARITIQSKVPLAPKGVPTEVVCGSGNTYSRPLESGPESAVVKTRVSVVQRKSDPVIPANESPAVSVSQSQSELTF